MTKIKLILKMLFYTTFTQKDSDLSFLATPFSCYLALRMGTLAITHHTVLSVHNPAR